MWRFTPFQKQALFYRLCKNLCSALSVWFIQRFRTKISKCDNSYLRKTGYEIMQSLIKHKPADDSVYDFIQKKRSEEKYGKKSMIAGLNKFLRVYYCKVMEIRSEN